MAAWQRAVSAMRRWLLPALVAEPHRWAHAEDVWHGARIVIADLAERAQAQHRLHAERLARALTASGAALLATQQIGALTGAVTQQLPELAIPGAWMALRAAKPGQEDATELLLAHDHERAPGTAEPAPGTKLAAGDLVPAVLRPLGRRASLVVAPLSFHERAFGYLVMEIGPREGVVYASLAEQVSSALEGARLGARLVEEATRRQAAERERLEKEMEIAARIQTSILPRALAVPGPGDRRRDAHRDRGGRRLLRRDSDGRRLLAGDRRRRGPRPADGPGHVDDAKRGRRPGAQDAGRARRASCCWR